MGIFVLQVLLIMFFSIMVDFSRYLPLMSTWNIFAGQVWGAILRLLIKDIFSAPTGALGVKMSCVCPFVIFLKSLSKELSKGENQGET